MSLLTRLRKLERAAGGRDAGCRACRDRRGYIVIGTARRLPDGTTAPEGDWPAPCEACGDFPEQIIEIVHTLVKTRQDLARREAEERASLAQPNPPHRGVIHP